jgi:predicted ATP-dependent endonuclease of OLD family
MKIQSISIERFTAFEHFKAELSPGLNVFIGANATGKSHLLKLSCTLL